MGIRRLFISDLHLGTREAKLDLLLNFLRHHRADEVYFVGDIVDVRHLLKSKGSVEGAHEPMQRLLGACGGAQLIYVFGNHDSNEGHLRSLIGNAASIVTSAEIRAVTGERLVIVHGHQVDGQIRTNIAEWKVDITCFFYYWLLWLDGHWNDLRQRMGLPFRSISLALKTRFRSWQRYADRFEKAMCQFARSAGYDGVICGHIHLPRNEKEDRTSYRNCGDWVEHCSVLAERYDGSFELIYWKKII